MATVPQFSLSGQPTISVNWADSIIDAGNIRRQRAEQDRIRSARENAIAGATGPDGTVNYADAVRGLLSVGDIQGARAAADMAQNEQNMAYKRERDAVDDGFRRQQLAIQRASLDRRSEDSPEYRASIAQRYGVDPNSPEGRSYILTGNLPPNRQARVPVGIQNAEASDLQDIQAINTINSELDRFNRMIGEGKLNLGPVANSVSETRNFLGLGDENSSNYASFIATLERLRNESLRLNKGVQTEGDAVRAWNELIANINDPKVVQQRLSEIMRYNEAAANFKRALVGQRREDNNLAPLDIDQLISPPRYDQTGGGQQQSDTSTVPPQTQGNRTSSGIQWSIEQ